MPLRLDTAYPNSGDFFSKLAALYAEMDEAYDKVAAAYGFDCRGCSDNCCQTRFYHHTHIETAYLISGFLRLDAASRDRIHRRAEHVAMAQEKNAAGADRLMCPVNKAGWCILYPYRPMICRMHGLPHELRFPGKASNFGPGCGEFARLCGEKTYVPFDRTPFYAKMAALEQAFKIHTGARVRLKKTVAEMLADAAVCPGRE
jgi:hypothetical protein